MATVTVYTAARMKAIEDASVVSGVVNSSGHLILTKHDGSTIDAGYIVDNTSLVNLISNQTIAGVKTFSSAPVVPANSFPESAITNLVADLAAKAADSVVVKLTGAQTIAGVKTFSSAPVVPANSFPESAVTNLVTDLAAKAADSSVVHLTGPETIGGTKTFNVGPVVPANSFPESAITNLVADLAAKAADAAVVHLAGAETITGVKTFSSAPVFSVALAIASGGTGTTTKSWVDLTTAQTVAGAKTFSSNVVAPSTKLGDTVAWSGYAAFMHPSVTPATGFGLLQSSVGATIINAPTGQSVSIRNNNTEQMYVDQFGTILKSTAQSVEEAVGRANGGVAAAMISSLTLDTTSYVEHRASTHTNMSDIRLKEVLKPPNVASTRGKHRDLVRSVGRPFIFKWKDPNNDQGPRWGLDANSMPSEFLAQAYPGSDGKPLLAVDPQSMIAALFGAINDVLDDVEDLAARVKNVETSK